MFNGICSTCGARLVFVPTKAGRDMPCEVNPVKIENVQDGKRYVVWLSGEGCSVLSGVDVLTVADAFTTDVTIFEPHWGNCNKPDQHRRRRT